MTSTVRPTEPPARGVRIRDRALVLLLRALVGLAERAGVDRTLRFGAAFGRTWHALHGPRTRRVRSQLGRAFPEQSPAEIRRLEIEVFAHLGQGLSELILMLGRHRGALLSEMEVIGLEHLEQAMRDAGGKGAVVIGPHLGNWELGAAKLAELGVPVSAVYRGLRSAALERAILEVRSGSASPQGVAGEDGIQQIAMGRRAGVQFVRALEAGRSVLVLLDQHARRDEGMIVDFFGQPARTRFAPLKLAARTGAPILVAFARRDAEGRRHSLTILPALALESGAAQDEDALRRNLQRATSEIERAIRSCPGQWIWTHGRWRVG